MQRIGAFGYFGQSPTYFLTSDGVDVKAQGNRSFSRIGAYGWWFIKDFDVETFYMHGQDNVYLGNGIAVNDPDGLAPRCRRSYLEWRIYRGTLHRKPAVYLYGPVRTGAHVTAGES